MKPIRAARRRNFFSVLMLLAAAHAPAQAQAMPSDAPGAHDHPLVARWPGSWLVGQDVSPKDEAAIPAGAKEGDTVKVEGRITRLYYLSPPDRNPFDVQRGYEAALEQSGFERLDACAGTCGERPLDYWYHPIQTVSQDKFEGWSAETLLQMWRQPGDERYWYGTLTRNGATTHVSVLSAPAGIQDLRNRYVTTVVQIVEP